MSVQDAGIPLSSFRQKLVCENSRGQWKAEEASEEVVMIRSLIAGITIGLAGVSAHAQQTAGFAQQTTATTSQLQSDFVDRAELLHRIAEYEAVAQRAEAVHSTDGSLTKVYVQLGGMYMDVAMYPLRPKTRCDVGNCAAAAHGPPAPLAAKRWAISRRYILHIAAYLRAAEKEQMEALKIRRERKATPVGPSR